MFSGHYVTILQEPQQHNHRRPSMCSPWMTRQLCVGLRPLFVCLSLDFFPFVHLFSSLLTILWCWFQVIVLQSYKNHSNTTIEAKYVFPLDDEAAVCGFEAFINDKHVVGVVKEKEEAKQEYRRAIAAGHGAYLMDEEAPVSIDWLISRVIDCWVKWPTDWPRNSKEGMGSLFDPLTPFGCSHIDCYVWMWDCIITFGATIRRVCAHYLCYRLIQ